MLKKRVIILMVVVFSCVCVRGSHDIRGRVLDENQLPLPGVAVELKGGSKDGNVTVVSTTDKNGTYYFDCVSNGHHTLTLKNPGFLETSVSLKYYFPAQLHLVHQLSVDQYYFRHQSPNYFLIEVLDERTNQAVSGTTIIVNGEELGSTGRCGRAWTFLGDGEHVIETTKTGFRNSKKTILIDGQEAQLTIFVSPDSR